MGRGIVHSFIASVESVGVGRTPSDASGWKFGTGFITQDMIQAHIPPAGEDTVILLCIRPPLGPG